MRIVIDTNVLISAAFFGGKPETLFLKIKDKHMNTYISLEIQNEYIEVFNRMRLKIIHPRKNSEKWFDYILKVSTPIKPSHFSYECRDPKDNKFIDCALSANTDFIITGDNDLLVLKQIESTKIVTVDEFLNLFVKNN